MLRSVHLILLLLMVVLVASLEDTAEPARAETGLSLNNVNDLDADASAWGYSRPWRYGWRNGAWSGWGGVGWGGRAWAGRGPWW
ncbi:uncharacterized protein LOC122402549 [Colletes gigas]|uniref:uncharacterized protein LOC122402549 n=1 Tax=Colletes gigas TaxID=935657 RepID=UPI001C9AB9AD|nr:uncharacterized protein LOC122402549 [Colletes gigas]